MAKTIDLHRWKAQRRGIPERPASPPPSGWLQRFVRRLLRVGLFRKIFIANAVLVAAVAVLVAWLTTRPAQVPDLGVPADVVLIVAIAALLLAVVNGILLRLALWPLTLLERTAQAVTEGDMSERAPASPLADTAMRHLTTTFNDMLDATAQSRRKLQDFAGRAQVAAEDERRRIAQELHDGIAQALAATRVRLRLAGQTDDAEVCKSHMERAYADLGATLDEVRHLAQGLRPPALELLGLTAAIDALARPIAETSGLEIEVIGSFANGLLTPDVELALYRIVQEALANVVRHAQATKARIRIRRGTDVVVLTIEDDGRGFQPGPVMRTDGAGLGLVGMQERAGYVGGRVGIRSEPGRGTRVTAIVPITEEAASYA